MCSRQGYLMFTDGLITTPCPTVAPNHLSNVTFSPLKGFKGFMKNKTLVKYHSNRLSALPPGAYSVWE